jgi:hypothetical protein
LSGVHYEHKDKFAAALAEGAGAFTALQFTPAGSAIDAAFMVAFGLKAGFELGKFFYDAFQAKDEAGIKTAAESLKSAIEDGGPVLISGLAGGLKSATGLLTKIKGGQAGAKAVQALAKLSNDAQEAIRALKLNEPEIARIAELVQKSPQVADDLLRQYLYKMRKAERKSLPFSRPADIGKDIEQSIENYNLVKGRGYPFGFQNVQQYQKFGENLTSALKKYNIPIGNIKVHGSAVHKTKPGDLDIAVLVSEQEFKNLGQRFYENARTSKRKKEIMQAISKGKIPSYYFGPGKGESVGTSIYGKSGDLSAQISLIVEKTEFDIGPYFNVSP